MRRRRFRKPGVSVALFPFLAVLICTMGSLILLLVILVQHARVEADTIKKQAKQETPEQRKLREQQEDAEWRQEMLMQAREQTVEQLSNARLELSHLEEQIRRLQDQAEELNRQAEELQRLGGERQEDASEAEAKLSQLRAEIDVAKQKLEEAKRRAAEQPRSFAVVHIPHSDGTLRRPIYIECTAAAVIIQPEGIVLGAQDFVPPLGPGNALDSALRAVRQYLALHGGVDSNGEPYPLLIVRPNGAASYSAARDAIKSWDDEFGYELIDAETELAYPPADPALAEEVKRAVELARRRQEMLARSAPTRYRAYNEMLREAAEGEGDGGAGFGAGDDLHGSPGGSAGASGTGGFGSAGTGGDGLGQSAGRSGAGPGGMSHRPTGVDGMGSRPDGFQSGQDRLGPDGRPLGSQGAIGPDGSLQRGALRPGGTAQYGTGQYGTGQPGGQQTGQPGQQNGQPGQRNGQPGTVPGFSSGGGTSHGAASQGQPGSRPGARTGSGGGNGGPNEGSESLAASRGGNWAVRGGGGRENPYQRPVRITITRDRLYILPEPHTGRPVQTIDLRGATVDHIDAMVEAAQKQIDGWGTPPVRGYWEPYLEVQVTPDGEQRFAELRRLMEGSGLNVKRRPE